MTPLKYNLLAVVAAYERQFTLKSDLPAVVDVFGSVSCYCRVCERLDSLARDDSQVEPIKELAEILRSNDDLDEAVRRVVTDLARLIPASEALDRLLDDAVRAKDVNIVSSELS